MKLSQMNTGDIIKMDSLIILAINSGDFIFAMPGQKVKRTSDMRLDVSLPSATKEEMLNAINKADTSEFMSGINALIVKEFLKN